MFLSALIDVSPEMALLVELNGLDIKLEIYLLVSVSLRGISLIGEEG